MIAEEAIPDLSFLAYRRTSTMLHIPDVATRGRPEEVFVVSSDERALDADSRA